MDKRAFEFAVVGAGAIGTGALYWLSRQAGNEVVGFERFRIGHDQGASGDYSRIIRLSYHDPAYTALTPATYDAWSEVEAESGQTIVHRCGGLDIGPPVDPDAVQPYADAMDRAGIPYDDLSANEAMERFPQFRLEPECRVLYQADGGLADPHVALPTQAALARARGATILEETPVERLVPVTDGVELHTNAGVYHARQVVLAADAWTNQLLAETGLQIPLTITEEQVTFFSTPHLREFAKDRFPIWIWHGADSFYGFPIHGEVATKAGLDVGGDVVTLETRAFRPNPRPLAKLTAFLERVIPRSLGPVLETRPCLYTMPPDRHFIIDRAPDYPQILVLQGAAHAFKFSSLLGQIAADLLISDRTTFDLSTFRLARPALTDPAFEPALAI